MTKYKLSKSEISSLINLYYDMGYDEDYAKEDLMDLVSELNKLPNPIKLYRVVHLDKGMELNVKNLGSHYSYSKKTLINSHYTRGWLSNMGSDGKTVLITCDVDKSKINVFDTISNNILYPNEKEITLKNKGYGIKIVSIEDL